MKTNKKKKQKKKKQTNKQISEPYIKIGWTSESKGFNSSSIHNNYCQKDL